MIFDLPEKVTYILNKLTKNGHRAYIVGGCVRDIIMGRIPDDYDITTSATPEQIKSCFEHTADTGIKHGTVSVILSKDVFEVTTFRKDGNYSNHRRPDSVEFVDDVIYDLERRDFTANALCYNEKEGIIDLFCGLNDIKDGILRAVGDPQKRFEEDALRIMRLYRFASTLGFKIESQTEKAALECIKSLQRISVPRILNELQKATLGDNLSPMRDFINHGALMFLGISNCKNIDFIKNISKKSDMRLFSFLRECDCEDDMLDRLMVSNRTKAYFYALDNISICETPDKTEIKRALNLYDIENVKDYILYRTAKYKTDTSEISRLLDEILKSKEPYKLSHLAISGEDIIKLGITGEDIGRTLSQLLDEVIINPNLNKKELLIKFI